MSNDHQNRWLNYGIVAVVLLLIGLMFYGISNQFERVNTTINLGYTTKALQNRYLAAQNFLDQQAIDSQTAIDLTEVIDQLQPNDALLLLNSRLIPEAYQDQIMDWVANGGHLLIRAQNLWDEEYQESGDPFLDKLGVRLYDVLEEEVERIGEAAGEKVDELNQQQEITEAETAGETDTVTDEDKSTEAAQCDVYDYSRLTLVDYDNREPPIQVQFASYTHLFDASGNAITPADYYPNQMLQYPVGQGMITAISNYEMWLNHNIGWYDHAYYLWLLVQQADQVWFVFDRDAKSLFTLIIEHLLEPLIAGLLLLALYLWYRAKRFGPIAPAPAPTRRSLKEHLVANARFNWRHQQVQPLIQKQRDEIKQHFIRRHGNHHNQDFIFTTLAKASGLSAEQVRWALTVEPPEKEQEFTQLMRLLQRLRNAV